MARKRACDRCHEIKQTCSGDYPCNRCKSKNTSCVYNRPIRKTGRPSKGKSRLSSSNLTIAQPSQSIDILKPTKVPNHITSYYIPSFQQQQQQQPPPPPQQQQQQNSIPNHYEQTVPHYTNHVPPQPQPSLNHYIGYTDPISHSSDPSPLTFLQPSHCLPIQIANATSTHQVPYQLLPESRTGPVYTPPVLNQHKYTPQFNQSQQQQLQQQPSQFQYNRPAPVSLPVTPNPPPPDPPASGFLRVPAPISRPQTSKIKTSYNGPPNKIQKKLTPVSSCTSCRRRKKRCENETWPCKFCKKNDIICSGPSQSSESQSSRVSTPAYQHQHSNNPSVILEESPLNDHDSLIQPSPSIVSNTSNTEKTHVIPSPPVSLSSTPNTQPTSISRPNFGSLMNPYPSRPFGVSLQNSDTSVGKSPQIAFTETAFQKISKSKSDLTELSEKLTKEIYTSQDLSSNEQFYLKYFVWEVVPILFSNDNSDSFLGCIIPLACSHGIIRDPILAISATHRSFNSSGSEKEIYNTEKKPGTSNYRDYHIFRSRSKLVGFSYSKETPQTITLLSILLVVISEVLIGDSLDWFVLLEKANDIIEELGGISLILKNGRDNNLQLIVVQLFCYLDLISSISTCISPYIEKREREAQEGTSNSNNEEFSYSPEKFVDSEVFLLIESEDFNIENLLKSNFLKPSLLKQQEIEISEILNTELGFRFGIAGEIFKIMGNISTLASIRSYRVRGPKYEKQFNDLAEKIELRLQNWSIPNVFTFENVDDFTRTQYALALQWGCFLRLHQVRYGYNRADIKPQLCLENILKAIKLIPENSNVQTGLLFALVLAGSIVTKKEDRNFILSRVRAIKRILRFPYIDQFEKLLINIWERDNREGDLVNWAALRFYEYPGLVMF